MGCLEKGGISGGTQIKMPKIDDFGKNPKMSHYEHSEAILKPLSFEIALSLSSSK